MRPLLVAALLLPMAASARPTLALRLAYAPAVGSLAGSVPISDAMRSQVPLQADALWPLRPELAAGLYASWGPGQVPSRACGAGASCSAAATRAGLQGLRTFARSSFGATPWAGAALGWEWASQRRERLGVETTARWNGPELALQGGAQWTLGRRFGLGPFLLLGAGRYERMSLETPEASASAAIADRAVHAWVHVGVRGSVDL